MRRFSCEMYSMNPTSIEVVIKDGKIEPIDGQQLPASGRGRLTILSAEEAKALPEVYIAIAEDGLPVLRSVGSGPVITTELVRRLEAETPW